MLTMTQRYLVPGLVAELVSDDPYHEAVGLLCGFMFGTNGDGQIFRDIYMVARALVYEQVVLGFSMGRYA